MANNLDDVVNGALRVLDGYGLEFCSMRRVAGELGVQPSALYHHVPNKQTLLALMADRIVGGVQPPGGGSVEVRATVLTDRLRTAMLAIRDGAEVVATAAAFRLGVSELENQFTEILGDRDAARTVLIFIFGHTQATQLHRQAAAAGAIENDPELDASFDRGLALILRGALV